MQFAVIWFSLSTLVIISTFPLKAYTIYRNRRVMCHVIMIVGVAEAIEKYVLPVSL
jgi:hypothetical protein